MDGRKPVDIDDDVSLKAYLDEIMDFINELKVKYAL